MINLFIGAVQVALLASSGPAANDRPPIVDVRMVCDQNCNCWPTRYRERRPALADRPDLACPPPESGRPAIGYYNGHYRTGPATGVGFDSLGARELPFPFWRDSIRACARAGDVVPFLFVAESPQTAKTNRQEFVLNPTVDVPAVTFDAISHRASDGDEKAG